MFRPRILSRLRRDENGVTLVEFALVSPVLVLALIGMFDICYNIYAKSILEGALQKAARDSSIEAADLSQTEIDSRVASFVRQVVPSATVTFDRKSFTNFSQVGRPEEFTDSNDDGTCNDGEAFVDVNGNAQWDTDTSTAGFGGARDAVLYTVTVSYQRQFPLHRMINLPPQVTTTASTVLRNQPYAMQEKAPNTVEYCS